MTASSQSSRKKTNKPERATSGECKAKNAAQSDAVPEKEKSEPGVDPQGHPAHSHLTVWPD